VAGARYVVLGLGPARSSWFSALGQWTTSGALPVEFVKCVSADEVRARLAGGRATSALVADGGIPSVDRDLLAAANHAGCACLVVDDPRVERDWIGLGASAVLTAGFGRDELLGALASHARMVVRADADADTAVEPSRPLPAPSSWRCPLVAVLGSGGTGVSTAAIALTQTLADDARYSGLVLLADLKLHAEQAMLHDARDVVPGVQELVEAHRAGQPSPTDVRALTFHVADRDYNLLLGLRHARHWATVRPRAFEAALESLQQAFRIIVCDLDADLEGEPDGGSVDVEERNVMARAVVRRADVVLVVGEATMKGLHSLVRVLAATHDFGIPATRVVPVVNRGARSPRARAGVVKTIVELAGPDNASPAPVFLQERKGIDDALRDGARLPSGMGSTLAGCVDALLARNGAPLPTVTPERVRAGSLGRWAEPEMLGG
jgi:MinD-like ATPase involved in chromosome partitioning or flagellar assembly